MLANFFSFQYKWGENFGMFLLELKERKEITMVMCDVCMYIAL